MDIGSGLIIQTRTVNGKPGIFLNTGKNVGRNQRDKITKVKYPIRSRVDPNEKPKTGIIRTKNIQPKKDVSRSQELPEKSKLKNTQAQTDKKGTATTNATSDKDTESINTDKKTQKQHSVAQSNKRTTDGKAKTKNTTESDSQEVNTKFVTLTQGQLNTILSLVKSKNDVDISDVLENKEKENLEPKNDDDEKNNETSENGENEKNKSRPNSVKSSKGEGIADLLKKDEKNSENEPKKEEKNEKTSGKVSRENSEVEKSTSGRRSEEGLPAAIRSSFFIGEAAPREHAYSARKRDEQRKWREELDKQRTEQREKKKQERNAWLKTGDNDDEWNKHFDTMLPAKLSPRQSHSESVNIISENPATVTNVAAPRDVGDGLLNEQNSANITQVTSNIRNLAPMPSAGIAASNTTVEPSFVKGITTSSSNDFMSIVPMNATTNALPQRSSHLRTMTSLLDPAQIEALELKRQKQDEHRRAIEAQVEERKRKKEDEASQRRLNEMEEEQRMTAERDSFAHKTEVDKLRHQMQENDRDRKTRELYQQMTDAKESALRDKLARRDQNLRNKGHDTSRLERSHKPISETTQKVPEIPLAQISQSSIASNAQLGVTSLSLPTEGHIGDNNPRQTYAIRDSRAPFAVTAQTDQGPIKLEISLNQRQSVDLVDSGVQTDERTRGARRQYERTGDARRQHERTGDARQQHERVSDARQQHERINDMRLGNESDADTEYMQLPPKQKINSLKTRGTKNQKLQNFEKDLDRQYDRHSRNVPTVQAQPKKNEKRPKWGVAKKSKVFVPASQRYTDGQQKERQVVNDPERSRVISNSPTRIRPTETRPKSPVIPAARNRQKKETMKRQTNVRDAGKERPASGIFATTEQAKYRSEKHSRNSPVPETSDFVQYRRTSAILDPTQVPSRPETGPMQSRAEFVQRQDRGGGEGNDPLLNPSIARQHDRQDQILREISILRQGLLIKQREVASYPAAMTHSMAVLPGMAPASLVLAGGGNLPERTNDTPLT